jgi:hypothetical protein
MFAIRNNKPMNFNQLTDEQIEHIRNIYNDNSGLSWSKKAGKLGDEFGVDEKTVRNWASKRLNLKEKQDIEPEQYTVAKQRVLDKDKKIFLISWAQNNTPVHLPLLKNITHLHM